MRKVKAEGLCFIHGDLPPRPGRSPQKVLKNITLTLPKNDDMERIAKKLGRRLREALS